MWAVVEPTRQLETLFLADGVGRNKETKLLVLADF
jgi:hypothetical protein